MLQCDMPRQAVRCKGCAVEVAPSSMPPACLTGLVTPHEGAMALMHASSARVIQNDTALTGDATDGL